MIVKRKVVIEGVGAQRSRSNFEVSESTATGKQRLCTRCQEPTEHPVKLLNHWWCPPCAEAVKARAEAIRNDRARKSDPDVMAAIRNREAI